MKGDVASPLPCYSVIFFPAERKKEKYGLDCIAFLNYYFIYGQNPATRVSIFPAIHNVYGFTTSPSTSFTA